MMIMLIIIIFIIYERGDRLKGFFCRHIFDMTTQHVDLPT